MSGLRATFENKDELVNSWWWHTAYGGEHTQHCARLKVCLNKWILMLSYLEQRERKTLRKLLIFRFLRELFFWLRHQLRPFFVGESDFLFCFTTKVQETFAPNASLSRRIKLILDSNPSSPSRARLIINAHVQRNNFPSRRFCLFFVSASDKLENLPKRKLENGAIYVRRMWMLPLTRINFLV